MKIFELKIDEDDDLSGVQYLSLVANPATEISWEFFSNQEGHNCELHDEDFSEEELEGVELTGEILDPINLKGAKISPVEFSLTQEGFVSVPPISSNPRQFDLKSGDGYENNSITRYLYVVDTALGSPLIRTSRALCRKMILANRVFSRGDIDNLSQSLTSAADTFKLVFRKKTYPQVDYFLYKSGKYCRHRWFQIEFPLRENETYEDALNRIPLKAANTRDAIQIGGGASRPFQSEWSILPPRKAVQMSKEEVDTDPFLFHMGLFFYKSRYAALMAEPVVKTMTKVKLCWEGEECIYGWCPVDIDPLYFEGSAEVVDKFQVRESFAVPPQYIQEAAQRAVDYTQKNGWGDCGTEVGKTRANQLAKGDNISLETITRMYSYGSRHKKDWEASKDITDGCGYLMMLSWGFSPDNYEAAMNWLDSEMKKSTEMNIQFSSNDMMGDITAVVFVPNQKIYRWDPETQSPYFVFMSEETIRKMLLKVSRNKPKNFINFEHSGMIFSGEEVYTYENWIVEDPEKDKSYALFGRTFPKGTWMTTIHFRDKKIFSEFVVSQKTRGVSLEGMFEEIPFNFFDVKKEGFVEPSAGESEGEFIGRCMGALEGEFPDTEQRLAVCYSYWKDRFDFPDGTCWEGYEPYGTKIVDGREVPNCVPLKTSAEYMGEIDIYGYITNYFAVCPFARDLFTDMMKLDNTEDIVGMVRSAALQADKVFEIEYKGVQDEYITYEDYREASLLVGDFKDLVREIGELQGRSWDTRFMDAHIQVIADLYNEKDALDTLIELKELLQKIDKGEM